MKYKSQTYKYIRFLFFFETLPSTISFLNLTLKKRVSSSKTVHGDVLAAKNTNCISKSKNEAFAFINSKYVIVNVMI